MSEVVSVNYVPISRRLTKLQFVERLGDSYRDILLASKTNVDVEIFIKMLDWATPESDGTSVDLEDSRTIASVRKLEEVGLIPQGKADAILS